jgi:hypothetical protein
MTDPEWQPISSAPAKDDFLAYGSYVYPGDRSPTRYYRVACRSANPNWPWQDEEGEHTADYFSHWMPLPPPPSEGD